MRDNPFLDEILSAVWSQDTQKRLRAAEDLSNYLNDPSNDIVFHGYERLIDGLVGWVNSSNFRVSLSGLEILHQIVDQMGERFKHSLLPVVPAIIERLGDSKQQVRQQAQELIQKFMYPVSTPQHVLEQLIPAFNHKAWRVREEVLVCIVNAINIFGSSSLTISKFVPHICKLLGDPNSQVRERAIDTLVEIYRHVGEKVRIDLSKKGIPSSRLSVIYAKFDQVARSGNMALNENDGPSKVNGEVETDGSKISSGPSRASSGRKTSSGRKISGTRTPGVGSKESAAAGAVDEVDFANAFQECPEARIHSGKDLNDEMAKIQTILSDDKNDWEQRVAALKKVRSLALAGGLEYDNFILLIRLMEGAFKLSAKDLRSTVIRETCVTLGFLSTELKNQFDHTAEAVLPALINLIPNSAKIMATSGIACISIILKNTHARRLVPIITSNLSSKSSVIRRQCMTYLVLILEKWETQSLKSNVSEIEEAIRKGISDADSEARASARRAFWVFHDHFRDKAESLLKSLDASKQKQLENDRNGGGASTRKTSTNRAPVRQAKSASTARSRTPSTQSYHSEDGSSSRYGVPSRQTVGAASGASRTNHSQGSRHAVASRAQTNSSGYLSPMGYGRSLSNIDSRAAERANMRAKARAAAAARAPSPQSRSSRSTFASRGYVSQPTSRSHSPERLLATFPPKERTEAYVHGVSPTKTRIPTPSRSRNISRPSSRTSSRSSSRGPSRDPSPETLRRERRLSEGKGYSPTSLPMLKRTTHLHNPPLSRSHQQSSIDDDDPSLTEAALWDSWSRSSPVRRKYSFGSSSQCSDDDNDSDAGSLCSDRSMGSRGNRTLGRAEPGNEVAEIVRLCHNNNSSTDRRDGISGLLAFLKSSRVMSDVELSKIKDCLTRLFCDPNNKVYSAFLDALCEFIVVHKVDLNDWLFVLLSRLLIKLGTDILGSMQSKIVRVLDVIRDSFPYDLQFSILTRFITDQTQTPNLKVKIAVLQYLQGLISLMDPSDFTNSGETRLAVSRIISWTTEPKSADVRKESAAVIVALFELNTPEFSMMLSVLPKSFQDGATKLLHSHLKSSTQSPEAAPSSRGSTSSQGYSTAYDETDNASTTSERPKLRLGYRSMSSSSLKAESGKAEHPDEETAAVHSPEIRHTLDHHSKIPTHRATAQSPRGQTKVGVSPRGHLHRDNSGEGEGSTDSLDSRHGSPFGLRSHGSQHEDAPSVSSGYNSDDVGAGVAEGASAPRATVHEYDPKQYQDSQNDFHPMPELNGFPTGRRKKDSETLDELDRSLEGMEAAEDQIGQEPENGESALAPILSPLSDPSSDRMDEKRGSLVDLLRMIREEIPALWAAFPKVFSALIRSIDDVQPSIRSLAIRVLKDMVRAQPHTFHDVIGTTVSKVLQAHKDPQKEVVRLAEEAAATIARSVAPEDCMRVLGPIINDSEFPVSLAALKMLTKVVEGVDSVTIEEHLPDLIPGLVKCYDHVESSVRKASVFSLVALHAIVGEEVLLPHLAELSGTKMKLLNLYIKRSQASSGGNHS
ncbi:CLIP-associating protein 1-A isoform X3 [Nematostella vectensis]|uniref:CLIP-associating protein 1-A isoform X3 n=1 Tax=Nematostella vectensis TaxID=45351 RepID=UPI002076D799|nr:CLIP-associating protein 1-A isoform X3 [Nematostella vectensis]